MIGALVLVMLTGCSGEPAAEPTPTRTASASPTTDSTPTPTPTTTPEPERPTAMEDPGVEGAVAAATYFLELFGYVGGGDADEWLALSSSSCVFCKSVSDEVSRMSALGHRQIGPVLEIQSIDATEITPGEFYGVNAVVTQHPWQELDGTGAVVDGREESLDFEYFINVLRRENSWFIEDVDTRVREP
ncbi:hypothetical protein CCE01nite_18230 [Cellulomonas cellasea]|uniref:DUF6318 domain-containing protein n=1 Tax=Cellulomonas cellasea TaxID=43670 RepID=A0A4Y3KWR3_9CELL|nr:hypothetical protein CCE01nite_18230 [Cellulomonas cellasea]